MLGDTYLCKVESAGKANSNFNFYETGISIVINTDLITSLIAWLKSKSVTLIWVQL